ncbi:urease isoform X1 [Tanacetum coccineum]
MSRFLTAGDKTFITSLVCCSMLEFVHDGDKSVVELMDIGRHLLGRRQILPTVPHLLDSVQVEETFPDGTKLITIHDPISSENGNLELALHGSFLPIPFEKFPNYNSVEDSLACKTTREAYTNIYGPTVGDKIRLGDTDLFAEVEKDFAVYGDKCVFGGGKVIRDGMGQASGYSASDCQDTVSKEVVYLLSGKAGNPDAMNGVFSKMIIGVSIEIIAGEGKIVTADAIDCHVHFICLQLAYEAIESGKISSRKIST